MASKITSTTSHLVLNDGMSSVAKGDYTVNESKKGLAYLSSNNGVIVWNLNPEDTTVDGESYETVKELVVALSNFSRGGGGGGGATDWNDITNKPVGNDRQVINGDWIPETLGWKHFSDQEDPPPFPLSTLVYNSELEEGNQFGFGQLTSEKIPFTIPLRDENGNIEDSIVISETPASFEDSEFFISYSGVGNEVKKVSRNDLKNGLEITGELIDPIAPGTQASPAVIPPGPAGQKRKFEPEPGFYQGFPEVTSDKRWAFYWNGSAWSLQDLGALPEAPIADDFGGSTVEAATQRLVTSVNEKASSAKEATDFITDKSINFADKNKVLVGVAPSESSGNLVSLANSRTLIVTIPKRNTTYSIFGISANYVGNGYNGSANPDDTSTFNGTTRTMNLGVNEPPKKTQFSFNSGEDVYYVTILFIFE